MAEPQRSVTFIHYRWSGSCTFRVYSLIMDRSFGEWCMHQHTCALSRGILLMRIKIHPVKRVCVCVSVSVHAYMLEEHAYASWSCRSVVLGVDIRPFYSYSGDRISKRYQSLFVRASSSRFVCLILWLTSGSRCPRSFFSLDRSIIAMTITHSGSYYYMFYISNSVEAQCHNVYLVCGNIQLQCASIYTLLIRRADYISDQILL